MAVDSRNEYLLWRDACLRAGSLHEPVEKIPPERLLQAIWFHQRLRRDSLRTVTGVPLTVFHPGFWNREAGPDFRRALIRIGDQPTLQGDVEIDLHSSGWKSHRHLDNPRYREVILHVVWEASPGGNPATLEMRSHLDSPLHRLERWHGAGGGSRWPMELSGHCRLPLRQLPIKEQELLLREAALARFENRIQRMALRAAVVGPWNALIEFLSRALGYKQNGWPMQQMGERAPALCTPGLEINTAIARLLGVANLLPEEPLEASGEEQEYLVQLQTRWSQDRAALSSLILPKAVWQLSHLRPANQPPRRLALLAHWLADHELQGRLEGWLARSGARPESWIRTLRETFGSPFHPFWSKHWTLTSPAWHQAQPLLGRSRLGDLAINVVLPWLAWRAAEAGKREIEEEVRRRFLEWPLCQDNAVLRLGRDRLLGGRDTCRLFRTAASQQGLHQIVGDFCDHSNALCEDCPLPGLLEPGGG